MASEFCYPMRVEFAETDMAGIVHFAQFFRYMEVTEHAFLRSLGLSVHGECEGRTISWPRGHVECFYKSPLRFQDQFEVRLSVRAKRRVTIVYDFRFLKDGTEVVAEGNATAICVQLDPVAGTMSAVKIPDAFDRLIEVAPSETDAVGPRNDAG